MNRRLRKSLKTIGVLCVPVLLRIFVFEIYLIPSDSMRNTLVSGDIVLVNKLEVGTRIQKDSSGIYKRSWSVGCVELGDIIVFNYPESDSVYAHHPQKSYFKKKVKQGVKSARADTSKFGSLAYVPVKLRQPYIKRCVALPGDSLEIIDRELFINGTLYKEPCELIPARYKAKNTPINDKNVKAKSDFTWCFPHSKTFWWDKNYLGPLYIPRKGDTLKINTESIKLYRRIIENYEYNNLTVIEGDIYINKIRTDCYVVKQNYYFAMGDNRDGSIDSRVWGFVPADHLIGTVNRVVISYKLSKDSENRLRWNRMFKKLL